MQNIMASKNGVFIPSCIQFKQCEILCISVGEKVKLRIICGTPHISSTICPHNTPLSFFLSPLSALRTETGSCFYHSNSPFSLYFCTVHVATLTLLKTNSCIFLNTLTFTFKTSTVKNVCETHN
jgi:hypothetical protein